MFKHSSSTLGLCVALFLVFSTTFSSFPTTRNGVFLAQASSSQNSAPTSDQQKGSPAPTAKAQPQKTPVPNSPQAVAITATNRDSFPNHGDGAVHQGDTITYTVVVTNNGTTDATGATFNDTVDQNTSTLVGGSPAVSPIAVADTYTATGNVRINTANIVGPGQKVTDNDSLTNGATLSGFGASQATANGTVPNGTNTVTTTNGATVVVNADGTFTFNPAPGFTGADSFFYAVTSATTGTATAQVTVAISNLVWFINNSGANGDGRLTAPFSSIANFNASAPTKDPNDIIFIYTGTGTYTGNLTLVSGMQLIGQGVDLATGAGLTAPPGSDALPGAASNPDIDSSAGDTVTLNVNNTIRGLNLRNSAGRDLVGSGFGTLTVSAVGLTGTGRPLDLTNGTLATTFNSIISTSSSGGQGINLSSVGGNMTVTGGTSITNPATQGILVTGSTANINLGNTTISGGTNGVSLQNNSAGTRTFGTLSISNSTGAGNPALLHANGGGLTTAGTTTITDPAGTGIDIQSSTTLVTFGGTTVNKGATTGTGVNLGGAATGNSGGVTFGSLDITTSSGTGLIGTENSGTITVTSNTGNISVTGGPALNITKTTTSTPLAMAFANVSSSSSGTQGINLLRVSGSLTTTGGSITGPTLAGFSVSTSTANITYAGSITQNSAQRVVDIQNNTGGTITLSGSVTSNSGIGTGIILNSNTGATINFTGGVALVTNANAAFTGTGGGTVSATQNNTSIVNTLTTTTGTALNITNTTIGASGLTFRGITSNGSGAADGIILDNTGSSGGLTVSGNGGACTSSGTCTGGTISNKTGADGSTTQGSGIFLNSTSNASFTRMQLNDFQNFAIRGTSVTGFTLDNSHINGVNGNNNAGGVEEGSISFNGLFGTTSITNSDIRGGFQRNIRIINSNGAGNITIAGCTIRDTNTGVSGDDNLFIQADNTATITAHVAGNTFAACNGDHMQVNTLNSATMTIVFTGNFYSGGGGVNALLQGITISGGNSGSSEHVNFNISNNGSAGSPLIGNIGGGTLNINQGSGGGIWQGQVSGNWIGDPAVANSGSIQSSGIRVENHSVSGTMTAIVDGNHVRQWNSGAGINFQVGDTGNVNAALNLTVTNNDVNTPGAGSQHGVVGNFGADINGANAVCADIKTNTINLGAVPPNGGANIRLRQRNGSTVRLPGYGGANTDTAAVIAFESGQNTLTPAGNVTASTAVPPGGGFIGGAVCAQPIVPTVPPPADDLGINQSYKRRPDVILTAVITPSQAVVTTQPAQFTGVTSSLFTSLVAVNTVVEAGTMARSFDITTPTNQTAESRGEDNNNSSISASAKPPIHPATTESRAQINRSLAASVPVKTALLQSASSRSREVRLNHAVRRSSVSDTKPLAPASGGTVSIPIGTLSAGSSVTITFQVTVDNAAPANASNVSNQGTVSGSNFASVLTDDPDTGAALDPTLTPLLHPTAGNGIVSGRITTSDGTPVEGAVVGLSGTQSRKIITDANGNYRFDNVETSGFYTVTPSRANYNFNPFNRSFTQLENTTEAIFTATSTGDSVNPLDTPEYFVRQQYVDLLGREPEEDGFNYWSDRIIECGSDGLCVSARRRDVAAAFFIEAEFQQTGSFIYGLYKGSLGRSPAYAEFSSDRQHVIGGPNLETMRQAFAQNFIGRAEFVAKYQANPTAESFVNALLANVQQSSGIDLSNQRESLTATYNTGANLNESRSLVVRELTESADFRQAEYNAAFVLTEYLGYLRRDAEPEGYNFWLDVLNNREPGNFRGMVCSFITSREYQQRFSAIVSHSNQECGQ